MINSIRLQNFRSYRDASFEFDRGANIIIGPNTSGKTNLLEAVMFLARGRSYRAKGSQLIKNNASWARLDGNFSGETRTVKLELKEGVLQQTFIAAEKPYKRFTTEINIPLVYFEPENLQSITRGPDRRRDFFDDILSRVKPEYKRLLNSYNRTLAQRNSLLKQGQSSASKQAFVWNVRLSELGSQLAQHRQELTEEIKKSLPNTYSQIAGKKSKVDINYDAQFDIKNYASQMLSKLEKNFHPDIKQGFTGHGPHREDYSFTINGQAIGEAASRGEVRSLLLSLKKIELNLVELSSDKKPILLLDDVLSELDGSRRQALVEMLKGHQSILTTTDVDTVLDYFASGAHKLIALPQ